MLQNDVARDMLRVYFGYDQKRKDGSYVEGTIASIARFDVCVTTAVDCLLEKKAWRSPMERVRGCARKNSGRCDEAGNFELLGSL